MLRHRGNPNALDKGKAKAARTKVKIQLNQPKIWAFSDKHIFMKSTLCISELDLGIMLLLIN